MKNENFKTVRIRLDGKKILLVLAVLTLCLGGAILRLHPMAETPYPQILDGLGEARYAEYISLTGTIVPEAGASYSETHTISTPAYDTLVAMSSQILHDAPIWLLEKLLVPFAILMLLGVYALTRRLTNSTRVALIAMMGMAAYGPLLLITQATWKECLGISLMPFAFLTFSLRGDMRMRVISTTIIFLLPFAHHMIALVVILTIGMVSCATFVRAHRERALNQGNLLDILVTVIAIDEMLLYYSIVRFDRLEYLTPENGLYLFVGLAILLALGTFYIGTKCISINGRKALVGVTSTGLILLLSAFILSPTGTVDYSAIGIISIPLISCLILTILGIFGISIWAGTRVDSKILFFSILAAPLTLVIYGLLRAGDLISLDIVTRSLDLLDLGIMIGLGTLIAYAIKEVRKSRVPFLISAICILMIATVPMAVDPETYLNTRNDINEFEIEGIEWAVEYSGDDLVQTDTHFWYVRYLFDKPDDASLVKRFSGILDFQEGPTMIASERWTTIGVKDLPYGWVVIDRGVFEDRLNQSDVLYRGGPPGSGIIVFTSAS